MTTAKTDPLDTLSIGRPMEPCAPPTLADRALAAHLQSAENPTEALRTALQEALRSRLETVQWLLTQPGAEALLRERETIQSAYLSESPDIWRWLSREGASHVDPLDAAVFGAMDHASPHVDRLLPGQCQELLRDGLAIRMGTEWLCEAADPGPSLQRAIEMGWLTRDTIISLLGDEEVYGYPEVFFEVCREAWPDLPWDKIPTSLGGGEEELVPAYQIALTGERLASSELLQLLVGYLGPDYRPPPCDEPEGLTATLRFALERAGCQPDWFEYLALILDHEHPQSRPAILASFLDRDLDVGMEEYTQICETLETTYPGVMGDLLQRSHVRREMRYRLSLEDYPPLLTRLVHWGYPEPTRLLQLAWREGADRCVDWCLEQGLRLRPKKGPFPLVSLVGTLHGLPSRPPATELLVRCLEQEPWDETLHYRSRIGGLFQQIGRLPELLERVFRASLQHSRRPGSRARIQAVWEEMGVQLTELPWEQGYQEYLTEAHRPDAWVGSTEDSLIAWLWQERAATGLTSRTLFRLFRACGLRLCGYLDQLTEEEYAYWEPRATRIIAAQPRDVGYYCGCFPYLTLETCLECPVFRARVARPILGHDPCFPELQSQWNYPGLIFNMEDSRGCPTIPLGVSLLVGMPDLEGAPRISDEVQVLSATPLGWDYEHHLQIVANIYARRGRPAKSARA